MSPETREATSEIPWAKVDGMRNYLIHAYFDIDGAVVWNTVDNHLPPLIQRLRELLSAQPPS